MDPYQHLKAERFPKYTVQHFVRDAKFSIALSLVAWNPPETCRRYYQ